MTIESLRTSQQGILAKILAPMLLQLGASRTSEVRQEYKIDTVVGALFVHIYDNWVHCRFENVAAARKNLKISHIRLNQFSGKWNWHHFDVNPAVLEVEKPTVRDHLQLLADVVWREIEDLNPAAVAASKVASYDMQVSS